MTWRNLSFILYTTRMTVIVEHLFLFPHSPVCAGSVDLIFKCNTISISGRFSCIFMVYFVLFFYFYCWVTHSYLMKYCKGRNYTEHNEERTMYILHHNSFANIRYLYPYIVPYNLIWRHDPYAVTIPTIYK